MKNKIVSAFLVIVLIAVMLPVTFSTVNAVSVGDVTKNLEKYVLQDFTDFQPYGDPNLWFNSGFAKSPVCDAQKGFYFSETGTENKLGVANVQIKKLQTNDWSKAKYITAKFQKNSVAGSFKTIFSFSVSAGWGWVGLYASGDPNVYYDNGSDELKKASYTNTSDGNKELTFKTGTSETVTVYIPVSSIKMPNGAGVGSQLSDTTAFGIQFTDLGNKGTAIENKNAVSVRELSLYVPATEKPIPDDETPAGDKLVEKMKKVVVQGFKTALVTGSAWPASFSNPGIDLWYNTDLTNTPDFSINKGLYVTDEGVAKAHGVANFQIFKLDERDFSLARYIVFTFRKNELSGSFKTVLSFVISDSEEIVLEDKTTVYYDNGGEELKKAVVTQEGDQFNRTLTFETGKANIIRAYVPISALRHAYSGREMPVEKFLNVNSVGVNFKNLGNKSNKKLSNADAVSLKEIAIYNYNGGNAFEVPEPPTTDVNELLKDLYHLEHQDFSGFKEFEVKNGLYNGDISLVGSASVDYSDNKGLFFKNTGTPLSVGIQALKTSDFASAKYIAVTFNKNEVTGSFRARFNFAKKPGRCGNYDISMFNGTDARVYYDNGEGVKTAVPDIDDMMTFEIGKAEAVPTVTVYIPTEYLYSKYDALGNICELRKITSEDMVNINSVVISFADIGNRENAQLTNEQSVSIKDISAYLIKTNDITLPDERLVLQDFKNVNMDLLYQDPANTNKMTPVLKNGELSLQSEKGHFDLVVEDLMCRNVTGIEYLAVSVKFKEATSLQLGVSFECETGNYGTGNNKIGTPVPYYVDDGFRIRKVNTPDVGGGTWVGPILSKPFNQDEIVLYLPMTSIFNDDDGVEGIGKLFFKNIHISSGWARSIDWIDENMDNPPYLWELEDAFSITKIEAVGSSFVTRSSDYKPLGTTTLIKDFSAVDVSTLEFDLDNAEAAVEPVIRDGALWFDNLMERFEPNSYIIDMYNNDLKTSDFTGADYLAVKLRGASLGATSYVTVSLEDENMRPFDYWGDNAYIMTGNGEIYDAPYDGRLAVNHQQYGLDVTLLFPMEFFQLSIFYLEDDFSELDLTKIDCVRTGLYSGKSMGRAALCSLSLIGDNVKIVEDDGYYEYTEYEPDYGYYEEYEFEEDEAVMGSKKIYKKVRRKISKKKASADDTFDALPIVLIAIAVLLVSALTVTGIIIYKRKKAKKT